MLHTDDASGGGGGGGASSGGGQRGARPQDNPRVFNSQLEPDTTAAEEQNYRYDSLHCILEYQNHFIEHILRETEECFCAPNGYSHVPNQTHSNHAKCHTCAVIAWIVDCGASAHMTGNADLFIPETLIPINSRVKFGNGEYLRAAHIGAVRLAENDVNYMWSN